MHLGYVVIATLLSTLAMFLGALKAARILHLELLVHCLRAPMEFFDTTPVGRILNRFSKDIDTLDVALPDTLRGLLYCLSSVCVS